MKIEAITQMIPYEKRDLYTCSFCGSEHSVKYVVLVTDSSPTHRAACNRCVFKHYVKGEPIDILPEESVRV